MSNVMRFGATGNGTADDTQAIRHAVEAGDGMLHFPPGVYRIAQSIELPLGDVGPLAISGAGGTARVVMAGPGPAFRLVGTHRGSGDPQSVTRSVFEKQRLPTIRDIEVVGDHPDADGVELVETMQAIIDGVRINRCRHGIHLVRRNRNVVISNCHAYHNRGVGVFLDQVNLHQINIVACHISYNRLGGIRIDASEVRNLQITGNDIEYNNHAKHGTEPEPTAEIHIDVTKAGASVNEVTIASNTIQATTSPGGANIRIVDDGQEAERPPGLFAITGNVIGSQENNVHLRGCYGFAITGNCIYSCSQRNLVIENSRQIVVSGNTFRRHTPNMATGIRVEGSSEITINGCTILDEHPAGQETGASLLELRDCERVSVSGCQFTGGVPAGVDARDCHGTSITACTIHDPRGDIKSVHAIRFEGRCEKNLVALNTIGPTIGEPLSIGVEAQVVLKDNLLPP